MKNTHEQFICPGEKSSFCYWAAIMGVSQQQLNDAILETGSVDPVVLSKYLSKGKSFFYIGMYLKAAWFDLKLKFLPDQQYL